eukprot:1425597-Rhodomonas_salina.1
MQGQVVPPTRFTSFDFAVDPTYITRYVFAMPGPVLTYAARYQAQGPRAGTAQTPGTNCPGIASSPSCDVGLRGQGIELVTSQCRVSWLKVLAQDSSLLEVCPASAITLILVVTLMFYHHPLLSESICGHPHPSHRLSSSRHPRLRCHDHPRSDLGRAHVTIVHSQHPHLKRPALLTLSILTRAITCRLVSVLIRITFTVHV